MTENEERLYTQHYTELNEIRKSFEVESDKEGTIIPRPKNNNEAYEQLKGLYGAIMCEHYKNEFLTHFGNCWIVKGIKDEIKEYEKFIAHAETKNLKRAFKAGKVGIDTNEYCFLRLKNNYYPKNDFKLNDLCEYSPLASVYGRYFLFYNFLQGKLKDLEPKVINEEDKQVKEDVEIINSVADQLLAGQILIEDIILEKSTPQPEEIKQIKKKKSKKEITKSKTLSEIWIGEQYEEVITFLKKEYREIKHPFIKDNSGSLSWGKNPAKGWQKYLAGFIYQCNEDSFINFSQYSNLEIIEICKNTFAIDQLSPDAFSQAKDGSLENKYITPFTDFLKALKNNANLQNR